MEKVLVTGESKVGGESRKRERERENVCGCVRVCVCVCVWNGCTQRSGHHFDVNAVYTPQQRRMHLCTMSCRMEAQYNSAPLPLRVAPNPTGNTYMSRASGHKWLMGDAALPGTT